MRHSTPSQAGSLPFIGTALLILSLAGCATSPKEPTTVEPPTAQQLPETDTRVSITLPPSAFASQFRSAESSLRQFDWMAAVVTLDQIPDEEQSADDKAYLAYLRARIDYIRGDQARALQGLQGLGYQGTHPALRYRALNLRRHILAMTGDSLASARVADEILRTAPAANAPALQRDIWRNLLRLDDRELAAAQSGETDSQWLAWLELASINRADTPDQAQTLSNWLRSHPEHPATTLPGGLNYLLEPAPNIDTVALLLPLSGRLAAAGKAVRDGYVASYYAARQSGEVDYTLLVLDLDGFESPLAAYDEALTQGANLVVGPLSKQDVAELGGRFERPAPVIALNRIDQTLPPGNSALVQLSLAPADEAQRIAELAFGQGARSALIIRPAGNWGDKVESALKQRWSALGGRVATSASYTGREEYSTRLKSSLGLDASEQRARDIRSMLASNIEFTARRRQDLDVVFLLSRNGQEARSIKPLLAFHYAGTLPVYATSSIYSGIPDARDRDLDGINLVETPWLLGANPGLRVAIAAGDTGSDSYTRLNALGADAFLLQSRFSQLQAGPDFMIRGNTGLLSLDPQLRIHRELSLATFDGGELKPQ